MCAVDCPWQCVCNSVYLCVSVCGPVMCEVGRHGEMWTWGGGAGTGSGNPSSHTPAQRTSPHPTSKSARCPWPQAMLRGGGGGTGTDLGTLSLIERWAADGRADKHGAQGGAAAVVAGALCNPGCPGLEGTEVGDGDCGQMDGPGEPIGYSSEDRCSPKPNTAQDPICTQPWVPILGVSCRNSFRGGQLGGCIPRTGRWCRWGT